MKPLKTENEICPSIKSTFKYTFVTPGAIGKGRGRGRGLKSLGEKRNIRTKSLVSQSSDLVNQYSKPIETSFIGKDRGKGLNNCTLSTCQGMETIHKNSMDLENKDMQMNAPALPYANQVKQYTQEVETSFVIKGRGKGLNNSTLSTGQEMKMMHENSMATEYEVGSFNKSVYANHHMQTPSKSTRSTSTKSSIQEMQTMNKLILEKEDIQNNHSLPPSIDHIMEHSQTTKKVGTNSKLFSRHLGKIVRDRNICPLGVSSWNEIKEEKLHHTWAAIEHKFEVDDMNDHRKYIMG